MLQERLSHAINVGWVVSLLITSSCTLNICEDGGGQGLGQGSESQFAECPQQADYSFAAV